MAREPDLSSDDVPDGFFTIDVGLREQFRLTSIDQGFLDILGLEMFQVIGKLIEEVLPEASHTLVLEKGWQAIDEQRAVTWLDTSLHSYGERICEVTIVPVFDNRGRCNQLAGTVTFLP